MDFVIASYIFPWPSSTGACRPCHLTKEIICYVFFGTFTDSTLAVAIVIQREKKFWNKPPSFVKSEDHTLLTSQFQLNLAHLELELSRYKKSTWQDVLPSTGDSLN